MPEDMFQRGARMIERVRVANLSHSVSYSRGGTVLAINATIDQSEVETVVEGFSGVVERMKDFLFAASDLAIAGNRFKPAPPDRIEETIDGITNTYEVMKPEGLPAWEYDDAMNLRVRVRTRRVS